MSNAGLDNWKRDHAYTCIHDCQGCGKQTRVEFASETSFNLLGIHCACGHYTKATGRQDAQASEQP